MNSDSNLQARKTKLETQKTFFENKLSLAEIELRVLSNSAFKNPIYAPIL